MKIKDFVVNSLPRVRGKKKSRECIQVDTPTTKPRHDAPPVPPVRMSSLSRESSVERSSNVAVAEVKANWRQPVQYPNQDDVTMLGAYAAYYSPHSNMVLSHSAEGISTQSSSMTSSSYSGQFMDYGSLPYNQMSAISESAVNNYSVPHGAVFQSQHHHRHNHQHNYHYVYHHHHHHPHNHTVDHHNPRAPLVESSHQNQSSQCKTVASSSSSSSSKSEPGFLKKSFASFRALRKQRSSVKEVPLHQTSSVTDENSKCTVCPYPQLQYAPVGSEGNTGSDSRPAKPKRKGLKGLKKKSKASTPNEFMDKSWYSDNDACNSSVHHFSDAELFYHSTMQRPRHRECSVESCMPVLYGSQDGRLTPCTDPKALDSQSLSGAESEYSRGTNSGRTRSRIRTNPWLPSPQPSLTLGRRFENCEFRESREDMMTAADDEYNLSMPRSASFDHQRPTVMSSFHTNPIRGKPVQRHRSLTPSDLKPNVIQQYRKPIDSNSSSPDVSKFQSATQTCEQQKSSMNDLNTPARKSRPNSILSPNSEFVILTDNIEQLANNISFEYEESLDATLEKSESEEGNSTGSYIQTGPDTPTGDSGYVNSCSTSSQANSHAHSPDSGIGYLCSSDGDSLAAITTSSSIQSSSNTPDNRSPMSNEDRNDIASTFEDSSSAQSLADSEDRPLCSSECKPKANECDDVSKMYSSDEGVSSSSDINKASIVSMDGAASMGHSGMPDNSEKWDIVNFSEQQLRNMLTPLRPSSHYTGGCAKQWKTSRKQPDSLNFGINTLEYDEVSDSSSLNDMSDAQEKSSSKHKKTINANDEELNSNNFDIKLNDPDVDIDESAIGDSINTVTTDPTETCSVDLTDACVQTDFCDDDCEYFSASRALEDLCDEEFDAIESTRRWLLTGNMQGSADTGYSSQPRDSQILMDEDDRLSGSDGRAEIKDSLSSGLNLNGGLHPGSPSWNPHFANHNSSSNLEVKAKHTFSGNMAQEVNSNNSKLSVSTSRSKDKPDDLVQSMFSGIESQFQDIFNQLGSPKSDVVFTGNKRDSSGSSTSTLISEPMSNASGAASCIRSEESGFDEVTPRNSGCGTDFFDNRDIFSDPNFLIGKKVPKKKKTSPDNEPDYVNIPRKGRSSKSNGGNSHHSYDKNRNEHRGHGKKPAVPPKPRLKEHSSSSSTCVMQEGSHSTGVTDKADYLEFLKDAPLSSAICKRPMFLVPGIGPIDMSTSLTHKPSINDDWAQTSEASEATYNIGHQLANGDKRNKGNVSNLSGDRHKTQNGKPHCSKPKPSHENENCVSSAENNLMMTADCENSQTSLHGGEKVKKDKHKRKNPRGLHTSLCPTRSMRETSSSSEHPLRVRRAMSLSIKSTPGQTIGISEASAQSLTERIRQLQREKDLIYMQLKEVQQEELSRQRHHLQQQRNVHIQRKDVLLETLRELKANLEEQSRKLSLACSTDVYI